MDMPDKQILRYSALVISAVAVVGLLFAASSSKDTVEVEKDMTGEDIRLYVDEGKASYVASWSNGPEGRQKNYKNISLDRWTALNTYHPAETKVEEILMDEFGENSTQRLQIDTERHGGSNFTIELTYDRHYEHPFSYQELKETVPDQIEGTVRYGEYTNTITLPVFTEAVGTPNDSNYSIEDFSSQYDIRSDPGATVFFRENYSDIDSDAKVLNSQREAAEPLRSRLDNYHHDPDHINELTISSSEEDTIEALNGTDYIEHKGTYYNITYEITETPPQDELVFDARVFDESITPDSPAKIQLELEINTDQNITLSGGAPLPFEVVHATSGDQRICMGSEAYAETTHVSDNLCDSGGFIADIGAIKEFRPDTVKENYTISHMNVRKTGEYTIEDSKYYRYGGPRDGGDEGGVLEYETTFNIVEN